MARYSADIGRSQRDGSLAPTRRSGLFRQEGNSMKSSERRSSGRPTKEQAAAIGDRVLDGARAAFCRYGIANSSVEQLAQELGVSKHTIYRRYRNKEALLDAVVHRDVLLFREALIVAGAEAADPLASLEAIARRYFDIGSSRDYAAFYLSLIAEAALSADLRGRLAAWARLSLEPLLRAVNDVHRAGFGRCSPPRVMSETLIDLLEGACNSIRLHDDDAGLPADPETIFAQRWAAYLVILDTRPADGERRNGVVDRLAEGEDIDSDARKAESDRQASISDRSRLSDKLV